MKGLENLLTGAINTVLGNSSMGEYETTEMFIAWHDNALIRFDAYSYRWNFASSGVIEDTEGVSGVFLCQRVIDISTTDPQVLTWAISRQANTPEDEADIMKSIEEAVRILEKVITLQVSLKRTEEDNGLSTRPEQS